MTFGRILMTGAAGRLGQVVRKGLSGRSAALVLTDRTEISDLGPGESFAACELSDSQAVANLCRDIDAIIHLGGSAQERSWVDLLSANIQGTINVYEGARLAGVPRIFLASSNHVTGMAPARDRLDGETAPAPDSRYGATKAFGETLAALYAYKHSIRSLCVRIGSVRSQPTNWRDLSTWLSHGDLVKLVELALTGDFLVETIYGVSANTRSWWNNEKAYALGYRPTDNAETWAAAIEHVIDPNPMHRVFQGGDRVSDELSGDRAYVLGHLAGGENS
jgi:uronate dehydrogenase